MPYAENIAKGTTITIGNGATSETFAAIKGIHGGPNGPSIGWRIAEAISHDRDYAVKKPTIKEIGPVTFNIFYDSTDTQHIALMTAAQTKALKNFKETLTDGGAEIFTFSAYVKMTPSADVEGYVVMAVELTVQSDAPNT